jgi:hypothetical protein
MKRDISIINKEVFETLGVVPPHYLRRGDLIAICRDEDIAELDFRHAANKALEKYMEFDSG